MRVDEVLDLDEAKTFLNFRTSVNDEELEGMIPAAIARVERHLDEALVDVQVTETITAFGGVLWPSRRPVKSIVSASLGDQLSDGDEFTSSTRKPLGVADNGYVLAHRPLDALSKGSEQLGIECRDIQVDSGRSRKFWNVWQDRETGRGDAVGHGQSSERKRACTSGM